MNFDFISNTDSKASISDIPTFQVQQIWQQLDDERVDVSHLIDRTYGYHSERELRWHLADRFSRPVRSLSLSRM
ncbi:hypothetical protein [Methylobacterium oryzisoli]|uniref:hypothetical protein n=1 Tax=Methylobacterium oryzisoli TaxID=3385502 RepID=UPI0038918251